VRLVADPVGETHAREFGDQVCMRFVRPDSVQSAVRQTRFGSMLRSGSRVATSPNRREAVMQTKRARNGNEGEGVVSSLEAALSTPAQPPTNAVGYDADPLTSPKLG
jgi:hypothetical protein